MNQGDTDKPDPPAMVPQTFRPTHPSFCNIIEQELDILQMTI